MGFSKKKSRKGANVSGRVEFLPIIPETQHEVVKYDNKGGWNTEIALQKMTTTVMESVREDSRAPQSPAFHQK